MEARTGRVRKTISLLFHLSWIFGFFAIVILLYLRAQPLPDTFVPQTSQIYDVHGKWIDRFYVGENRQVIPLEAMSPYVIQATLAIEDHRFYHHFGFDLKGIARAILVNLKHMDKVQGASTLTQQLARNLYLNHDRTWDRKIREAIYTIQLEMQYDKDTILERYLNEIYYGHATYGIEAAAQLFFNKSASELTLAESALLAGVPKGPRYFSPYYNETNAKKRQKLVLQAMVEQGYITQKEADEAYNEPLEYMPLKRDTKTKAPYFRDYVRRLAQEKLGVSEEAFIEGGYRIYTTLDLRMQQIAEEVVEKYLKDHELQVALVAIDPRNGYIKAMVGGRNYEENQYNRVFATTRQPGSAFKPFVYLTALEQAGFSPVTRFKSEPTLFTYDEGRQTYAPQNFGNQYANDYIDLRQAIARSDNIYAVHTILTVGEEAVIDMARRLGIHSPMEALPSLALGTFPISPFEMASAYATIANGGEYVEPVAIIRIEDHRGNVLYEAESERKQVVDPAYTYVLTHLMESVFEPGGTASRVASILKRPVAGKTGTTNTDAWMVGFTPELSTAVWLGYDRDRHISPAESYLAAPIFAEFTERALEAVPPKIFPMPDNVVTAYIEPESGLLATTECPNARMEVFVAGTEPAEYCSPVESEEEPMTQPDSEEQKKSWWDQLLRWWTE